VLDSTPKIKILPGESRRERVISADEETRYLAAVSEPLASIASVLADTGMRPEECFRLRWDDLTWVNGRDGALFVTRGKTASARRVIPMTSLVRLILESRWKPPGSRKRDGYGRQPRAAAT
jgi:integrase